MNVRDAAEVKAGIAETVSRFGRLDVAVNNAGIAGKGELTHEVDEEEFGGIVDVDLYGVWRCQKEEIRVMLEQEYVSFFLLFEYYSLGRSLVSLVLM